MLTPVQATTIEVDNGGDTDPAGGCTLRQAILSANTNLAGTSTCAAGTAGTDTIIFSNSVVAGGIVTLSQASVLSISEGLVINGPDPGSLVINGMDNAGVFSVRGNTLSLNDLTISGGSAYGGGGISASFSSIVSLVNSAVSANSAYARGGGISANSSSVSLNNSTVSGNSAIYGGGIYAFFSSIFSLVNSTVSNNAAIYGGGVMVNTSATVSLSNSIVAGNVAASGAEINNVGSTVTADSANLFGDSSHTNLQAFASSFIPGAGDINASSDGDGVSTHRPTRLVSILKPLDDNGGPTQTHGLAERSPALNAGNNTDCGTSKTVDSDQRGEPRDDSLCDIGSFEGFIEDPSIFVVPLKNGNVVIFSL